MILVHIIFVRPPNGNSFIHACELRLNETDFMALFCICVKYFLHADLVCLNDSIALLFCGTGFLRIFTVGNESIYISRGFSYVVFLEDLI